MGGRETTCSSLASDEWLGLFLLYWQQLLLDVIDLPFQRRGGYVWAGLEQIRLHGLD